MFEGRDAPERVTREMLCGRTAGSEHINRHERVQHALLRQGELVRLI